MLGVDDCVKVDCVAIEEVVPSSVETFPIVVTGAPDTDVTSITCEIVVSLVDVDELAPDVRSIVEDIVSGPLAVTVPDVILVLTVRLDTCGAVFVMVLDCSVEKLGVEEAVVSVCVDDSDDIDNCCSVGRL